ncbi:24696_t:CDS:2, partial [Dentiscutata erythropus]
MADDETFYYQNDDNSDAASENTTEEMLVIYENAKCAQKICSALLERVEYSKTAMESLKRNQHCYEEYFKKQDYYNNWVKFINILEDIKKFAKEVTQLPWYKKYTNGIEIKNKFEKLIKEFEEICEAINFKRTMYNAEKKEMEAKDVTDDLELLKKTVATLKSDIERINSQLPSGNTSEKPSVPRIDPNELKELSYSDVRSSKKVTDGFEARVSNFKHSCNISESSSEIKNLPDVIRWLAPEMMLQTTNNYNIHSWDDDPLKRPSDTELQLRFKKLYDDHITSKMVSPQIRSDDNVKEFPIFETPD